MSSITAMKRKNRTMMGTKEATVPTPLSAIVVGVAGVGLLWGAIEAAARP